MCCVLFGVITSSGFVSRTVSGRFLFTALAISLLAAAPQTLAQQRSTTAPPTAEDRIDAVLDAPLKERFEFAEMPLDLIAEAIAETYGIPVQLDVAALDAEQLHPDMSVSVAVEGISLRSALTLLLSRCGVDYVVADEVLFITTRKVAASRFEVRVYRVDDLWYLSRTDPPDWLQGGSGAFGYSPLIDLITSCVERNSWAENGTGQGRLDHSTPGILAVAQTRKIHRLLDHFLRDLRNVKRTIEADQDALRVEAE
jgi:hypothetical protein